MDNVLFVFFFFAHFTLFARSLKNRLSRFVARHKSLLNALLHQNPTLLDKSLSAMVHNPRCRQHLDFENKRAFFRSVPLRVLVPFLVSLWVP